MGRRQSIFVLAMVAMVASGVFVVRADLSAATRASPTAVAIADFKNVVGRWSGILYGRPGATRGQDWVELALYPDGTFTLVSARMVGVFGGSGRLRLADGKLMTEGEKAQVTFTLYQRDGKRFLRAEGSTASGQSLRADLYSAP
jgi:hypothetical protein